MPTSFPESCASPGCPDGTTDRTTDETTSHSAMPPKNGGQAAGYSHLTDETTSQSTKPPKNGGKVAGYNPAQDAGQVIDETTNHLTKAASCQVIGYGYSHPTKQPKTVAKCLVMRSPELCCSRIQNAGSRSDELLCKPHLQHVTGKASGLREQVQAALPAPDGFT